MLIIYGKCKARDLKEAITKAWQDQVITIPGYGEFSLQEPIESGDYSLRLN